MLRRAGSGSAGKNIVILGGGTGTSTLLSGLRKYFKNISVIVSTADDGGSTGMLRKELGVLPPGDIRQCLLGLSNAPREMQELFNYRFSKGNLSGHNVGNIILSALEKIYGVQAGLLLAGKILNSTGEVIPVTLKPTVLSAVLDNGKIITGEHNIDEPNMNFESGIKNIELKPNQPVNPRVLEAIKKADVIIFGPGDLYTSTLPNLLVRGVRESIKRSKAQKIFITNIMTKFGQTQGYKASDFIVELEKYLGDSLDVVLVNKQVPKQEDLKKYAKEKAEFVEVDVDKLQKFKNRVIVQNFLQNGTYKKKPGDKLKRSFLRHNSLKLAKVIYHLT